MLKKVTTLGLSALFLGCGFGFVKAAPVCVSSDEAQAARIQRQEMSKYRPRNTWYEISLVKTKIRENEAAIKRLESERAQLKSELATKVLLQKYAYTWYERVRLTNEIDSILSKIDLNEAKIESLKDKRSELDHELAVLLQIREA